MAYCGSRIADCVERIAYKRQKAKVQLTSPNGLKSLLVSACPVFVVFLTESEKEKSPSRSLLKKEEE